MIHLLSLLGLISGFLVAKLSVNECRGKDRIIQFLMIPFALIISFTFMPYSLLAIPVMVFYLFKRFDSMPVLLSVFPLVNSDYLGIISAFIINHLVGSLLFLKRGVKP